MSFVIRMGVPEMEKLWNRLQTEYRSGKIGKHDKELYKKWGRALKKLSQEPTYQGLHSHVITPLSERYGMKVWESYLENKRSAARRMFWVYGPGRKEITIIGLDPHPESSKHGAYDRIKLSDIVKDGDSYGNDSARYAESGG